MEWPQSHGRQGHEDGDMEAAVVVGAKKAVAKSGGSEDEDEDVEKESGDLHAGEEGEAEAGTEELAADSVADDGQRAVARRDKQGNQKQRSDGKRSRKENEVEAVDERKVAAVGAAQLQRKDESAAPAEGDGNRMRRCKQQQNAGALPAASPGHAKRQFGQQPGATLTHKEAEMGVLSPQPMNNYRRRQRQGPRRKEEKDIDRVLRSLTTSGTVSETPPPAAPAVAATAAAAGAAQTGKGTKRSKRVALRLANEEPPPPPLKLPKLHLGLTRKEIQEDWVKITGHKYTGKPKKSTIVQRGLGLCTSLTCPSSIRYLNEPQ